MDLNRVILAGNLARDPDLRYLPSGTAKCTLTVAVSRPPDKTGERVTDFLTIVAWRKTAETLGRYARKGEPLIVEGRLQTRDFTAENGQKRHVVEVLLTDFSFVGSDRGQAKEDTEHDEAPARRPTAKASHTPSIPRHAQVQRESARGRASRSARPAFEAEQADEDVPF